MIRSDDSYRGNHSGEHGTSCRDRKVLRRGKRSLHSAVESYCRIQLPVECEALKHQQHVNHASDQRCELGARSIGLSIPASTSLGFDAALLKEVATLYDTMTNGINLIKALEVRQTLGSRSTLNTSANLTCGLEGQP